MVIKMNVVFTVSLKVNVIAGVLIKTDFMFVSISTNVVFIVGILRCRGDFALPW